MTMKIIFIALMILSPVIGLLTTEILKLLGIKGERSEITGILQGISTFLVSLSCLIYLTFNSSVV